MTKDAEENLFKEKEHIVKRFLLLFSLGEYTSEYKTIIESIFDWISENCKRKLSDQHFLWSKQYTKETLFKFKQIMGEAALSVVSVWTREQ